MQPFKGKTINDMNITRKDQDNLTAELHLHVDKADYQEQVDKTLNDYRKSANIPGFRKGKVPKSYVQKRYGTPVLVEEVNKIIQKQLQDYLTEEKLAILGNPMPKDEEEVNWENEEFDFVFEVGIAPEFEVDVQAEPVTSYVIKLDDESIDDQVNRLRKQYGKLVARKEVEEKDDEITGIFSNEEHEIDQDATFTIEHLKNEDAQEKLMGAKPGDKFTFQTGDLFKNDQALSRNLGIEEDKAKDLDIEVEFEITEVNYREPAEMNQDFYDKLFGEGKVSSEEELRKELQESAQKQFQQQTDQKLLNDVVDMLIEKTDFELPDDFLKRWLQRSSEEAMTAEEAEKEYERTEKGLRYQLIQDKLMEQHEDLRIEFEDLKNHAREQIKGQMAQFGQMDPSDKDVDDIVARVLSNQEEVKRLSDQLQSEKILAYFKEHANLEKEVMTYEEFLEKAYSQE